MAIDFEPLDLDQIKKENKRLTSEGKMIGNEEYQQKFVRMPVQEGFVAMRILPRRKGQEVYGCTRIHTITNPTTGVKSQCHCPRELTKNSKGYDQWIGDCIICKYYTDLWQKSEGLSGKEQESLQNKARELKPLERYYYNVIVRSESDGKNGIKTNVGPKIYSCGKTVHTKIMISINGDEAAGEPALGDITHPNTGRDFKLVKKITKSGYKEFPNYDNSRFEEPSSAGTQQELQTWFANLHDLTSLRVIKTPEDIKHALRIHTGMISEGDKNNDELDEFYNSKRVVSSVSSASTQPASKVRDDIVAPKQESKSAATVEESMADDDFLKELGNI